MQRDVAPWRGAAQPRDLPVKAFVAAAGRLGCEPAALAAVWEVEAGGRHFLPDGSVIRRFEPHHVPRAHWTAIGFRPHDGEPPWRAALRAPEPERARMFAEACRIDLDAALVACSWGAPQIMGFNAEAAGFASARAMVEAMATGAPAQLDAFVALIDSWGLATALRARDWLAFARRYNGTGRPDHYARLIEEAYRRHAGAASPVVLRVGDRGPAVRRLQRALGVAEDGAFGPETLAAVRALQAEHDLAVDGVVGARTWAALDAAPPTQDTPADAMVDRVKEAAGAVAAVVAAAEGLRQVVPEQLMWIPVAAACACAVIAAAAWGVRWARS